MLWTCLLAQTREMNLCCIQAVCPVVCEGGVSNVQTPLSVSWLVSWLLVLGSVAGLQPWLAHCCLLIQLCCPCSHVTWLSFSHPLPLGPYCPLGIPTSIRVSELNSNPGISKSMPWLPPLSPSALGRSINITISYLSALYRRLGSRRGTGTGSGHKEANTLLSCCSHRVKC